MDKDIVFGSGGGRPLLCDVYTPPEHRHKHAALVFLHGGGFTGGSKDGIEERVGHYAALGYTCIASEYRLSDEARWPAQIHDAKAAVRWVRTNATLLDVDPEKVSAVGFSAGGLLALLLASSADKPGLEGEGGNASTDSSVAACVAYYPVIEIEPHADGSGHPLMPVGSREPAYKTVRPTSYLSAGCAPTAILHGTADSTVPFESSQRYFEQLRALGVSAELHALDGLHHIFDRYSELGAAAAVMGDMFLHRTVVAPREYPAFGIPVPPEVG